jgi:hypothetical protein
MRALAGDFSLFPLSNLELKPEGMQFSAQLLLFVLPLPLLFSLPGHQINSTLLRLPRLPEKPTPIGKGFQVLPLYVHNLCQQED